LDTECTQYLEQRDGNFEHVTNIICAQQMCSKCVVTEDLNIDFARVANVPTCSGRTTWEYLLCTSDSAEHTRIIFMLFDIIIVDTIEGFVQTLSGTELDIVYVTAACELNLFSKIR